jgi:SAM-dependent methyltransferase
MELQKLQESWNVLGQIDPFWAILSDPEKAGNRWKVSEFFETGEAEINGVMGYLRSLGLQTGGRRALDFGCGAGRLSQALCSHFLECDGVDIAPSMLELARQFNRFPERCRYHLNSNQDLRLFPDQTFDFIYCNIVLQHMEPKYSTRYIAEFLRVLDRTGLAVFQAPTELSVADGRSAGSNVSLPPSAFRAKLRILQAPVQVAAGSRQLLTVRVRNLSECVWPGVENLDGLHPVRVGVRWHREPDGLVIEDGGRADLPRPLAPGEELDLELAITAPRAPGTFNLEIDLVQELVAWFRDKGSFATRTTVQVDTSAVTAQEQELLVPVIEMHGLPRETVEAVVSANGGELVDVLQDQWAGRGWRSFRYCVRKR